MPTKNKMRPIDLTKWPEAKSLYVRLLHSFYERNELAKSKSIALSLLRMIDLLDPLSTTLPGNEYRALIAEIDGDLDEAIRYREVLVKKIDEYAKAKRLQDLALKPDDYADQLDLLAALYCENGRLSEAEAAISKSEKFCAEAGIPFDGKDVRKQIERERKTSAQVTSSKGTRNKKKVKKKPISKAL